TGPGDGRDDEVLLGPEVVVDEPGSHTGLEGDVLDRRGRISLPLEHAQGGIDDVRTHSLGHGRFLCLLCGRVGRGWVGSTEPLGWPVNQTVWSSNQTSARAVNPTLANVC